MRSILLQYKSAITHQVSSDVNIALEALGCDLAEAKFGLEGEIVGDKMRVSVASYISFLEKKGEAIPDDCAGIPETERHEWNVSFPLEVMNDEYFWLPAEDKSVDTMEISKYIRGVFNRAGVPKKESAVLANFLVAKEMADLRADRFSP